MERSNLSAGPQESSLGVASEPEPTAGESAKAGLSRRRFLAAGTGAAAALAVSGPAALAQDHAHPGAPRASGAAAARPPSAPPPQNVRQQAYYQAFGEPPAVTSYNGVLETTLRVVEVPIAIPQDDGVRIEKTRTYNGMVPGPTLKCRAGDTLKIHLINELPANDGASCPPQVHHEPHCFNTTNLHYHGLHVSPLPPSDAVLLEVPPLVEDPVNGKYDYCVTLPEFHKPGTHWYHAHKHGSTALQLINGMAGALIIEDPPDRRLTRDDIRDYVFVLQEILGPAASSVYDCATQLIVSFTVNSRTRPTLTARPGEVQRWRIINATGTVRGITLLRLIGPDGSDVPIRLVAVDGIYLPAARDVTTWTVAPGGRADFLVRFPTTGTYVLMKDPPPMPTPPPAQPLAIVEVAGLPLVLDLPEQLPKLPRYLQPITEADRTSTQAAPDHVLKFTVNPSTPGCPGRFSIDDIPFDPHQPPLQVPLGATELWEVRVVGGGPHPFHIHINPFIVTHNGGQDIPEDERFWQDTVLINGTVRFLTRYQNFHGKFVLHCHILNHEDWGMMLAVEVTGQGYGPCEKVTTELPLLPAASSGA